MQGPTISYNIVNYDLILNNKCVKLYVHLVGCSYQDMCLIHLGNLTGLLKKSIADFYVVVLN
jgi:hypothetical protein